VPGCDVIVALAPFTTKPLIGQKRGGATNNKHISSGEKHQHLTSPSARKYAEHSIDTHAKIAIQKHAM
jgi:hypothetical protein